MKCFAIVLLLTLSSFTALSAEKRVAPEVFVPEDRTIYDTIKYSPAVRVGDTLYLSGVTGTQVARNADEETLRANFVSIFERIAATLEKAGGNWDNVVMMRSYHLDYVKNFFIFNEVKNRYMKEPYPAWTALGVAELTPGSMAEVEVIAWLGGVRAEAK